MIRFELVDVKDISSSVPRSHFSETTIDQLADLILECGGLVKPLVLKRTGLDSFEVLEGHLEYYAATKAKQKDSIKGETVNAFVFAAKHEQQVLGQIEVLGRSPAEISSKTASPENLENSVSLSSTLDHRVTNLEARLTQELAVLRENFLQQNQQLVERLSEVERTLPKPIKPLEVFNNPQSPDFVLMLQRANVKGKTAEKLHKHAIAERKKGEFKSFKDLKTRFKGYGLGADTLLAIVDACGG